MEQSEKQKRHDCQETETDILAEMINIDDDQLLKVSPASGERETGEYLFGFEDMKD